ncbi:hypothetical protein ACWEQN_47870 [Streptomyces sp. NPDC004129]
MRSRPVAGSGPATARNRSGAPRQQHVSTLLTSDTCARPAALSELKQLYALAWRILRGLHTVADRAPQVVRTALAECGGVLPQLTDNAGVGHDAHNAALGTALAHVALHPGHRDHDALFDWILEADQSLHKGPRANLGRRAGRWSGSGPALVERALARLDRQATLQARLRYASAGPGPRWPTLPADTIVQRAALIPSMLWPGWTMRLLPRLKDRANLRVGAFRRGCSSFLLLPGADASTRFAWNCTEFRFRAPQALRSFLRWQAEDNLARHGVDEPLPWEPPNS